MKKNQNLLKWRRVLLCIGLLSSFVFLTLLLRILFAFQSINGIWCLGAEEEPPLVLLISYDGFRWDYLNKSDRLLAFKYLQVNGVQTTKGLQNAYVTVTAPNHYSIVTGLYEESHGIIENKFYDKKMDKWFDYFNDPTATDPSFFGGKPLWLLNQDGGRSSGCVMWVGCDLAIGGRRPERYAPFNIHSPWEARVEKLISWFSDREKPINFGLLYIEEPDATGHQYGPDSPEIERMLEKLDALTSYLLYRLYEENLLQKMNIIFTSDHGMTLGREENKIKIDQYVKPDEYDVMSGFRGTNLNILPKAGKEEEVYTALVDKHPKLKVHRKSEMPNSYHYSDNDRIMPLQLEAILPWRIDNADVNDWKDGKEHGYHGYNNSEPDMQPYFLAIGPAFKVGAKVDSFQNVDIYPLICHILNLKPEANNGSLERVSALLKDGGNGTRQTLSTYEQIWSCLFSTRNSRFCTYFEGFLLMVALLTVAILAIAMLSTEVMIRCKDQY